VSPHLAAVAVLLLSPLLARSPMVGAPYLMLQIRSIMEDSSWRQLHEWIPLRTIFSLLLSH